MPRSTKEHPVAPANNDVDDASGQRLLSYLSGQFTNEQWAAEMARIRAKTQQAEQRSTGV